MNWEDFLFGVGLVAGGAVGGALLTWAYLVWPVGAGLDDWGGEDDEVDDVDAEEEVIRAARSRHPSARRGGRS